MVVTLAPQLVRLALGHFALRTPILLLGALDGTQTVTAAMAAVQERSGSRVAVSGYTPAYPTGNILLTTCGTIIVVSSWRADVAGGARYQANEQGQRAKGRIQWHPGHVC